MEIEVIHMTDQPRFTHINYEVCCYCKNVGIVSDRDGDYHGCSINLEKNGRVQGIHRFPEGCEKFEASGLPAHLIVLESLVQLNPRAQNIPGNADAIETSYDFANKMSNFPHVVCDYSGKPLQVKS